MPKQRMPRAELQPRPSDVPCTLDELRQLTLFRALRRRPSLERFPGAVVLRSYRAGEVVYTQGEPGWTASYVLTTEESLALRRVQLASGRGDESLLRREIGLLEQRLESFEGFEGDLQRAVGMVHLAVLASSRRRPNVARLLRVSGRPAPGSKVVTRDLKTLYIPVDGPPTLSYDTLRAPLLEGELFGEECCLYRTPRPATVVVTRDCLVLELLRNILDQMLRDPAFAQVTDLFHRTRARLGWRKFSLFADLDDTTFAAIRPDLELVRVEPGTIICDEHARAEAMYVVATGLVQTARNVTALLPLDAVRDWRRLCAALREGAAASYEPPQGDDPRPAVRGHLWRLLRTRLPERSRRLLDADLLSDRLRIAVVDVFNDLLQLPRFSEELDLAFVAPPADGQQRDEETAGREARRHHRLILERIFPDVFQPLENQSGLETPLAYLARGDWFGDEGIEGAGRYGITGTAHGHPGGHSVVELVRIPASVFRHMVASSPAVAERVRREAERRRGQLVERLRAPVWQEAPAPVQSATFEELGLIQGQKVMLIDLDRCTRCGDCVRACASVHADGLPRLMVGGPRFGRYLVPTTCRACLDPVCLIGCPVGAIHRGSNREIVIENWCIGCSLCADNCPYGSIRMQDVGIIPEEGATWRLHIAGAAEPAGWQERRFRDDRWPAAESPLCLDRDFLAQLPSRPSGTIGAAAQGHLLLRHLFTLAVPPRPTVSFRLEITTRVDFSLWINGGLATPVRPPRQDRHEYELSAAREGPRLVGGVNVLALRLTMPGQIPTREPLFRLRLDEMRPPAVPHGLGPVMAEDLVEKIVEHRAVVCDLCSSVPGRQPACVDACSHGAAIRVDARQHFAAGGVR
jgi:Fe-S-cluster-containing hydrogenase component 2/CRP-like cAMP-binding protein